MNVLKRIVIICNKQYEEYVSSIRSAYDSVEVYGFEIDGAVAAIPEINPGAVVFLNYYSQEDFQSGLALEHLMKIRSVTGSQVLILSSSKPPVEFIMQASEYGAKSQWGKEIDFDIDNIPETDFPDQGADQIIEVQCEESRLHPAPEDDPTMENGGLIEEPVDLKPADKDDISMGLSEANEIIACVNEFKDLIPGHCTFVDRFEDVPEYISETTRAVIITSSMLSGSIVTVKNIIRRIPKESVQLYAIDNFKLNQLIYGEIGLKEGIKFYPADQINLIFDDIKNINEVFPEDPEEIKPEDSEEAPDEKPGKKKLKFNLGNITEKLSTVVEATRSIKPEIKLPKLQFRDTHQTAPKNKVEFVERNKVLLIMSPISTGKTEIASNLAAALAADGFKTALVDLDTSKKGCFYNFPLHEKDDLFILRKVFIHLGNGGLEDDIESYAFKSGSLHVYTAHRDVEVPIDKAALKSFIRFLKSSFDAVVIDAGKELPMDIIESLMDVDGVRKFMVTTQSIEDLNTIPYCYKWFSEFPLYYKDWVLIINRSRPNSGISVLDLRLYFEDPAMGNELSFKLSKMYSIPESVELMECKSKRSTVYGKDEEFSEAMRRIVEDWKKGEI